MRIYVTDTEALLFWYVNRAVAAGLRRVTVLRLDIGTTMTSAAEIAAASELLAAAGIVVPAAGVPGTLYGPDADITSGAGCHHILTSGGCNRHRCGNIVRHSCGTTLPPDAFVQVGDGIYVASPEYVWVRLAARISRIRLIRLGCAMCSGYRLTADGRIVYDGVPITTPERLAAFVAGAAGTYGAHAARAALPYVVTGAESPAEIATYMLVCLPPQLGGLGAPKATLNHTLSVATPALCAIADRPDRCSYRIDLAWPSLHCGVEYLGKHHDQQYDVDRERMNALVTMGERVLQVKYADLARPELRRRFFARVATLVGVSLPEETSQYLSALDALLTELFGPLSPRL